MAQTVTRAPPAKAASSSPTVMLTSFSFALAIESCGQIFYEAFRPTSTRNLCFSDHVDTVRPLVVVNFGLYATNSFA